MHHASIRTADIFRAIAFYEQLGFQVTERFTTGMTLACWLEGWHGRIELLQVPEPRPAADAFHDEQYTGYYHLSFELTDDLTAGQDVPTWLAQLTRQFQAADQSLTILLPPTQQMIGDRVYEVTFLADPDGLPLEFIRQMPPAAEEPG